MKGNRTFTIKKKTPKYPILTSWGQNQLHVTVFSYGVYIPVFRPHLVLKLVKSRSQYHVSVQSY